VIAACRNIGRRGEYWLAHSSCKAGQGGRLPMPPGSGFHFCAMLHRSLWERAGGFDEAYRAGQGCEDNDWLWRLHAAGALFILRDDLVVWHRATALRWPRGGLPGNRRLLKSKWRHQWEEIQSPSTSRS
jgi:GT2 family glycosyltransferase